MLSLVAAYGYDAVAAAGVDVSCIVIVSFCFVIHTHACTKLTPPPPPLHLSPQRDGSNLYMTLHVHKVDDRTLVEDGKKTVPVPAGWNIAPGDADDVRVCGAHPWQSNWLVFADTHICGTAMCDSPSLIGTQPPAAEFTEILGQVFPHAENREKAVQRLSQTGCARGECNI